MTFPTNWISNPESASGMAQETARRLHTYARIGAPTLDDAKAIGHFDVDALIALITLLEHAKQGAHLAALKDAGLPKRVRKAAGRAVHRLGSQGIKCEVTEQRGGSLDIQTISLPSYMTIPSGDGLTVALLSDIQYGQPACAFAVYNDEGLLEVSLIDMPSRSRLRKIMTDIVKDPENPARTIWVEANPDLIRTRLIDAIERSRNAEKPLPEGHAHIGSILEGPVVGSNHPAYVLLGDVNVSNTQRSGELLGDIRAGDQDTIPGPLVTEAWFAELETTLEASISEDRDAADQTRREQLKTALLKEAESFFTTERRFAAGVRLLDSAYLLGCLERVEEARISLSTATSLMDTSISPLNIPWCCDSITRLIDVDTFLLHLDRKLEAKDQNSQAAPDEVQSTAPATQSEIQE
ncbi:MAG: hypothetical protein VX223_07460 [Myxococcota bacterium]|nr:hypothetical protein [Myxococcota bacterium]